MNIVKLYKFPSIESFSNAVKSLKSYQRFVNYGREQEETLTVKFVGTTKLHGCNAGVVLNFSQVTIEGKPLFAYYPQSRSRVLSVDSDHLDFAQFALKPKVEDFLTKFMLKVYNSFSKEERKDIFSIAIYGEWVGVGVQKGVAVSELERLFAPFEVIIHKKPTELYKKIHPVEEDSIQRISLPLSQFKELLNEELRIFPISEIVKPIEVNITLDSVGFHKASEIFEKITAEVEAEDPFAKFFGVSGIGEGVVWKMADPNFDFGQIRFKVKGEKHAISKVKSTAPVDFEKLAKVQEAVDMYATENRFIQGVQYLQEMQIPLEQSSTGNFVKWVQSDILKEHQDAMLNSNINAKNVVNQAAKKAAAWFKKYLEEIAFS